ncbi:hypothetical protein SKAU_G00056710 [Synaphobranchus kaupii]|uniref:Uncharacterized protein n=1 Tax=Synaphobranchus kaupii TaxID=118154 RepID=A0A9Q1J969_SYNKA|nr:hypothetical protein SKAU_G00056710 [Synaphobranchus kaupii]
MNRFQMDLYSQQDSLIHLVWEVNMRLKLQDISLGLGVTPCTSELPALNVYDIQHAALSDLESTAFNKPAGRRLPSSCFDGRSVEQRAIQEITEVLAHPPARPVSEVVGETVTSLLAAVMETPNKTASSRAFSDMAVGMAVCVLEDLRAAGRGEEQVLGLRCWRWARASMVGALHRDLLEQTGFPGALQAALRGNNATVTTAITAAITTLLTAADATPNVSPTMPVQEEKGERITPPEELISQSEELITSAQLITPPEELISQSEELITSAQLITPPEELISQSEELITSAQLITPPEELISQTEELITSAQLITPPEELISQSEELMSPAKELMSPAEDLITEQRGVQDGFEVETTAPLQGSE